MLLNFSCVLDNFFNAKVRNFYIFEKKKIKLQKIKQFSHFFIKFLEICS